MLARKVLLILCDMISVVLALCLVIVTILTFYRFRRARNLPPQPSGWPVLGHLPKLTSNPPRQVMEWSEKLGPTISLWFGPLLQVVIHDYDTARKVFNDDNATGHDRHFIFSKLLKVNGFTDGEKWLQNRRVQLSTLRDLGMGKSWLQDSILEEVGKLLNIYAARNGESFDPKPHLTLSVSNVVAALEFGKRFDHSDSKFLHLTGLISESLIALEQAAPASAFPVLQYLPGPTGDACRRFKKIDAQINAFIEERMAEHEDLTGNHQGDFLDRYRFEATKRFKDPTSHLNEYMLQASLYALFFAGTDTTMQTMCWAMIYMTENPSVLQNVQREIEAQIGDRTPITTDDKTLLPYTEAVLLEIQRLASLVPFSIPHCNFEPMQIDGFDIPARTILTINSYAMHRDPKYWKHPDQFHPEHFLSVDGSVVVPKSFAPFGIGKHVCIGESLAKMSLFLFFTNLVQKFDLQQDPEAPLSSANFRTGFLRTPLPFVLRFVERR